MGCFGATGGCYSTQTPVYYKLVQMFKAPTARPKPTNSNILYAIKDKDRSMRGGFGVEDTKVHQSNSWYTPSS